MKGASAAIARCLLPPDAAHRFRRRTMVLGAMLLLSFAASMAFGTQSALAYGCYGNTCGGKNAEAMGCTYQSYVISSVHKPVNLLYDITSAFTLEQFWSTGCDAGWAVAYIDSPGMTGSINITAFTHSNCTGVAGNWKTNYPNQVTYMESPMMSEQVYWDQANINPNYAGFYWNTPGCF